MYTTMNILRRNKACADGYGKMASFFGVNPSFRDVKIPLHVVALVAGEDELGWVIENAMVIDREEFEALHRRILPRIWDTLLCSCEFDYVQPPQKLEAKPRKRPPLSEKEGSFGFPEVQLTNRMMMASTYEEMLELLKEAELIVHSRYARCILNLQEKNILSPAAFLTWIISNNSSLQRTFDKGRCCYLSNGSLKLFSGKTSEERIAAALSEDPYAFISTIGMRLPPGLTVDSEGRLTIECSSDERRFILMRFLTMKTGGERNYLNEIHAEFIGSTDGHAAFDALNEIEKEEATLRQSPSQSRRRVTTPPPTQTSASPTTIRAEVAGVMTSVPAGVITSRNNGAGYHATDDAE